MEITVEKSEETAQFIKLGNTFLFQCDPEYLQAAVDILERRAARYDSAAALNTEYTPEHSQLLLMQARCLKSLIQYIQLSQEIDKKTADVETAAHFRKQLNDLLK